MPPVEAVRDRSSAPTPITSTRSRSCSTAPSWERWVNRRKAAADWVTGKDNPWFAQAIVNRMWGKFLGTGLCRADRRFPPRQSGRCSPRRSRRWPTTSSHSITTSSTCCASFAPAEPYQRACVESTARRSGTATGRAIRSSRSRSKSCSTPSSHATEPARQLDKTTKNNFVLVRDAFIQQLVSQMGTDDMAEVTELEETIPRSLMLLNGALVCGSTRASSRLRPGRAAGGTEGRCGSDRAVVSADAFPPADRRRAAEVAGVF